MVEVENAKIVLAAFDATASLKVHDHPLPISLDVLTPVDASPRHVGLTVPTIGGLALHRGHVFMLSN
jgi:hypothetical protein